MMTPLNHNKPENRTLTSCSSYELEMGELSNEELAAITGGVGAQANVVVGQYTLDELIDLIGGGDEPGEDPGEDPALGLNISAKV